MAQRDENPSVVPRLGHFLPCSEELLSLAAREQSVGDTRPAPLGELLVRRGTISPDDLSHALDRQRMEYLQRCSLFAHLDEEALRFVASRVRERSLRPGENLLVQGEMNQHIYIVTRGQVEVFRVDPQGDRTSLATRHPGDHVGEMSYASKRPPSASVQALDPVVVLALHFDDLDECVHRIPVLAKAFWEIAAVRLQQLSSMYEEGTHRQKAAEKSLQHLYSFLDLSESKLIGPGIDGLIESLVFSASRLVDAERASLFLIDPDSGELWSKVAEGSDMKEIRIPKGAGVAGWVAEHAALQNIHDAYADERFNREVDRQTGFRTRNILCGPVVNLQGETLGVVQAINKRSGDFDDEDERLFSLFSHQAAIAVENFNLYNRILVNHQKMSSLLDIATTLTETLDLGGLIGKLVTKIMNVLGCDRCSFFVYDERSDELWSLQAVGLKYQEIRFPASIGLAGHAARTAETVNVEDAYKDLRFNPEFDRKTGFRTRSVLCVPLVSRDGRVTSVVQAINKQKGAFDDEDEELLKAISAQISVAVENSKLHADTVGMKNYLEGVQTSISSAIVTLDSKDCVVTANKAALSLLEADPDNVVGTPIRSVLAEGNDYVLHLLQQAAETDASAIQYDVVLRRRSGVDSTVNVNALPLTATEDEDGLVLIMEDVSSEKRVRSMLTRYMDKEIVDRVLDDPTQQTLGGQRSVATVLFCDIRGFTSVAERLTAEGTMDLLNEYFGIMHAAIADHSGMLDKFIGDALLAVFGLPFPRDDDAARAIRSALAMQRDLAAFNAARKAAGKAAIHSGIGINTDEVISGNLGSESRMDYTVIGDGVNVASRLEGLTKFYGTPVLVSESTLRRAGEGFVTRKVDDVIVKGRTRPLGIHEVVAEVGEPVPEHVALFDEGFASYRERRFEHARECFARCAPTDSVSAVFLGRCETLLRTPPDADWDGVWRADRK